MRKLVDALLSFAGWSGGGGGGGGGVPAKTVKGLQALPNMLHRNWNWKKFLSRCPLTCVQFLRKGKCCGLQVWLREWREGEGLH